MESQLKERIDKLERVIHRFKKRDRLLDQETDDYEEKFEQMTDRHSSEMETLAEKHSDEMERLEARQDMEMDELNKNHEYRENSILETYKDLN